MVVRTFQIVAGMSVNGKIADEGGSFQDYSSVEDQQFLQQKIEESDVLIMGRRTFDIHSGFAKKPVIIFTRSVSGIVMGEGPMHYFHDSEEELLNLIELLQYRSITILGGSEIYHWFLQSCLVTDVYLTVEPYLINVGKNLLTGSAFEKISSWKLKSMQELNQRKSLVLHYQP